MGQTHIIRDRDVTTSGARSLGGNLLAAFQFVETPYVAIIEDDDYYFPTYLEDMVARLKTAHAAGDGYQRYYNVQHRMWRVFPNRGAALCQTGFRSYLLPVFREIAEARMIANSFGYDGYFWSRLAQQRIPTDIYTEPVMSVGIKGLPGRAGLGVGHRPAAVDKNPLPGWHYDPSMNKLRELIGADADVYESFYVSHKKEVNRAKGRSINGSGTVW